MRRRSSSLTSLSFARMRSRRVFRLIRKLPRRDLPQMKVKPRKLKVSGLPSPRRLRSFRRKAAELDQPGLLRMQRQRELLQPLAHRIQEAPGVALVLEADDEVVGIAHDDHVARGLAPSPALGPEVEHVVQVDVGKQRRDHRPLPGPPVTDRHDPVFQDARLEPFLDQADDAPVADPMLHEPDQPFLARSRRRTIGCRRPVSSSPSCAGSRRQSASSASCVPRPGRNPYEKPRKSSS